MNFHLAILILAAKYDLTAEAGAELKQLAGRLNADPSALASPHTKAISSDQRLKSLIQSAVERQILPHGAMMEQPTSPWLLIVVLFLFGLLAGAGFIATIVDHQAYDLMVELWRSAHIALFVALLAAILPDISPVSGKEAPSLIAVESMLAGWVLLILFILAVVSGPSSLLSEVVRNWHGVGIGTSGLSDHGMKRMLSLVLSVVALAWLAHRWAALRQPHLILATAMIAAVSWLIPALGAVLLMISICITSGRQRLAMAGAVAAAWIIGGFCYQFALSFESMH